MWWQQKLASLAADPRIVEMLLPPASRTCLGTWLQGLEFLLVELPPKNASTSICKVQCCSAAAMYAPRLADWAHAGVSSGLQCYTALFEGCIALQGHAVQHRPPNTVAETRSLQ